MKKNNLISIFTIFISLFISASLSAENIDGAAVKHHIDLSKYTRTVDFAPDAEGNSYSAEIKNIKIKKNLPVTGDTVVFYFNCSSNVNISNLECELFYESFKYGKTTAINSAEKKNFVSTATFSLDEDLYKNVSLKITISEENLNKKPWLQFKAAKLPSEKVQVEPEKKVSELPANKVTEDNLSTKNKDVISADTPSQNSAEITATETAVKETPVKEKTAKKTKSKKSEKKLKTELPQEITDKMLATEESSDNWYICKIKSKKQAGKVFSGPFENSEQAVLVWKIKNLPEKKLYCIAKNLTYVTDSPSSYFRIPYEEICKNIEELGREETLNLYFLKTSEKNEDTKISEEKTPVVIEKEEEKIEESEVFTSTPVFELPLILDNNDLYSKYQKEYLQDYAPVKKLKLPEEKIREKIIENPDEADQFGCTLLMRAARNGNNWEIKSLLASGADVNLVDKDGWTALMYASRYQENISTIESLINAGAKIKVKNKYDLSPLILAATYNGNPEIVKKLLSYYSVSEKDVLQAFVLLLTDNSSSDFSKIAKIEAFLDKSIPLNTFYNGKTPLMYAASYCNSTSILKRLMEEGAITSIRSTDGKTAFDYAQDNNKLKHDDIFWSLNKK